MAAEERQWQYLTPAGDKRVRVYALLPCMCTQWLYVCVSGMVGSDHFCHAQGVSPPTHKHSPTPSVHPITPTTQQGPFPESTLMRMLVRGLPGLDSSTYCWCAGHLLLLAPLFLLVQRNDSFPSVIHNNRTPGMEQWQPVGALQHFHALLTAQARTLH